MQRSELLLRGDDCLTAYLRHLAVNSRGGGVEEDDRFLLFAGAHEYPGTYTNGVIRKSDDIGSAELLARADAFFGRFGRPYMVWVRAHVDDDLEAEVRRRGMWLRPPEDGNPGVVTFEIPSAPAVPRGIDLRRVLSRAECEDFVRVVALGYELEDASTELSEALLFSIESMLDERVIAFLAYREGVPLTGCLSFLHEGTLGMQWAASRPGERGLGLARITCAACCEVGFNNGAVCAIGQASAAGLRVWTQMGFDVFTHYRRYLASAHLPRA